MRQHLLMALTGVVVLGITGCGTEETPPPTAVSPSPVASPSPVSGVPTFVQPLVAQNPAVQRPPIPPALPGLIQSTNPDERARQVQASMQAEKSTNNPFEPAPVTLPKLSATTPPTTVPPVSQLPQAPAPSQPQPTPFQPASGLPPAGPNRPSSIASQGANPLTQSKTTQPSGSKPGPSIATLPPRPSTTLAEGVEVSGVIQLNGVSQAIVKAPNEPTSRYVQPGQRLSNGQVLVKRIEMNPGGTPIVILEQNGIEVSRGVGNRPQGTQQQTV
ncbi:MAG TPA: hypothetical protein V6C46_00635 [Coleofasciculaceae cyanobacterium]